MTNRKFIVFLAVLLNVFTIKTSFPQYSYEWEKKFGVDGRDEAKCVIETRDHGLVMTGFSREGGKKFVWVIKTNRNGIPLWGKTFENSGNDMAESIIETRDGGLAIAGSTWGSSEKFLDFWIIKLDSMGNKLWDKTYGGRFDEVAYSIIETYDGGLAVAGYSESNADYVADFWIVRLDENGNKLWDENFGGPLEDCAYDIVETSDRGFSLVGFTRSMGGGDRALWVIKLDSEGEYLWGQTYRKTLWDVGTSIVETYDGNLAVCGYIKADGIVNYDMIVMKLAPDGSKIWTQIFGGRNWGEATSLIETYDRSIAITGFTQSKSGDISDFWIIKLSADGTKIWDMIFQRNSLDYAYSIVETYDKGLAVAGSTYAVGAISWDYALLKFDNILFPDSMKVFIKQPLEPHTAVTKPQITISNCIQTFYPLKDVQIYINNELKIDNALDGISIAPTTECAVPFEQEVDLTFGKNEIKIISTNTKQIAISKKRYVYYLPQLLINDW